jgi:predicted metal-dependent enzyme (double-stranded beta helix superfamily)
MTGAHRSGDGGFGGDEGSKLTLIQQVATACRKVFKEMRGYSEDDIAEVKALLDRVGASDVGLGEKQRGKHQPQIEFVDVLDTPTFTIGIFILPKGRSLPLHDHPGMTVLSKVLYGSLLVSRFDKEDYSRPTDMTDFSEQFPVKVRAGTVLRAPKCCCFSPAKTLPCGCDPFAP